jgi:hypothetical protein
MYDAGVMLLMRSTRFMEATLGGMRREEDEGTGSNRLRLWGTGKALSIVHRRAVVATAS